MLLSTFASATDSPRYRCRVTSKSTLTRLGERSAVVRSDVLELVAAVFGTPVARRGGDLHEGPVVMERRLFIRVRHAFLPLLSSLRRGSQQANELRTQLRGYYGTPGNEWWLTVSN